MYKNNRSGRYYREQRKVSILVLMDLCIKTVLTAIPVTEKSSVSILVLMDLCIKTFALSSQDNEELAFQSLF